MAVLRKAWQFPLDDARTVLKEIRGIDDLLRESVAERVQRIRSTEYCRELLVLARLAPDDDETWGEVLRPDAKDFGRERAAAGRLTSLLAEISRSLDARAVVAPQLLEAAILRAGMDDRVANDLLRGRRLPTLLREEGLVPGDLVDQCKTWLPGGWLPADRAHALARLLSVQADRLEEAMMEAAEHFASDGPLSSAELEAKLRLGLGSLTAGYAAASGIVWILQD